MDYSTSDAQNQILSQVVTDARQHLVEWVNSTGGNPSIVFTYFQQYFLPVLQQPLSALGIFNLLEELICASGGICIACGAPPLRGGSLILLRNRLDNLLQQL